MSRLTIFLSLLFISAPIFAEEAPAKTDEKKTEQKSDKKFANPVPGKCVVMPEEDADPDITTEFEGKTYSFCCNKCARVFAAYPDKYLKKAAENAKKDEKKDEKKDDKKEEKKDGK
jgi:YHS domain-containing protein